MRVVVIKFSNFLDYTLKLGHKKFWKLDRNVLKEDLGTFRGGILENRELESRWSNIAKRSSQNEINKFKTSNKKLRKWKWWSSRNLKVNLSKWDTRSSENWKKNVLKEDLGTFRGGMLENRELKSRRSNIAKRYS